MKILLYSDLHLEFGYGMDLPAHEEGDVLVLAGDIITFRDFTPLAKMLRDWAGEVLCVAGNHEYYGAGEMQAAEERFREWFSKEVKRGHFLRNTATVIGGVNFFGGTMWTDFDGGNPLAMERARNFMNDYRCITLDGRMLRPLDTAALHSGFKSGLAAWLDRVSGKKVVISHHAPVEKAGSLYAGSPMRAAFNSLDMREFLESGEIDLWIYGHTHECDDQIVGTCRVVSNQRGYPRGGGGFECGGFKPGGVGIEVDG